MREMVGKASIFYQILAFYLANTTAPRQVAGQLAWPLGNLTPRVARRGKLSTLFRLYREGVFEVPTGSVFAEASASPGPKSDVDG